MAWWAGRGSRRNRRATFSWPTSPSGSTTPDTCLRPRAREFSKRSRLLPPRKSRIRSRYTMQAGAGGGTGSPGGSGQGAHCLENERARSLSAAPGTGARLVLVATPPRQRQGPASQPRHMRRGTGRRPTRHLARADLVRRISAAAPPRNAVTNCGGVATVCSPCPLHGPTTMDLSFRRLRRVSAYGRVVTMIIS